MAVRKLKEELNFDRCFTDVCKVYVNGKELDISGLDTYDQVGDVFVAECRRTPELEGWIREYMNSLGDPLVDDSDSVEEVCRLFAKELDMDLHDSEPGEFYVDGSGSVFDNKNVRVEIFEENVKRERNKCPVARARKSVSESKTSKRRTKRVNEDFDFRDFFTDVKFYVNGNLIPFDGCTAFDDVGNVLYGVCRKVKGFEDWIREYMDNLNVSDVYSLDTDELCYWFAYEMVQDFNESYDDGFYLDGSGIVYNDHGVSVEAFEGV